MATYDQEVKKPCENCKGMFPESKVQLHEAYCLRNIRKCPDCTMFVDKREMEEHQEEFHKKVSCDKCGQSIENQTLLQKHIDTQCRLRPRQCKYCDVKVPIQEFEQHEYTCGCRTKQCEICKKNVLVRDYDNHVDTCVGIVEEPTKPQRQVEQKKPTVVPSQQSVNPGLVPQNPSKGPPSIPNTNNPQSLNNAQRNEREKELQKRAEESKRIVEDKSYKQVSDVNRNQANVGSNQQQKELLNKPTSQYPSSNLQQNQRVPVSLPQVSNNQEKNKISNETKPTGITGISSNIPNKYGNQISTSSQQQQIGINKPQQPEINKVQPPTSLNQDKYGIKPPSSQGARSPLIGNKFVNQGATNDLPGNNKVPSASNLPQQYPSSSQNKYIPDQQGQISQNVYNARINQQPNPLQPSAADKQKKEFEQQNNLPTKGAFDNLKTVKNPTSYDYKLPEQSQQQKPSIPSSMVPQSNQFDKPNPQYPSNKPASQYPYSQQQQQQITSPIQQQGQNQYQQKQNPGIISPNIQSNLPSQSKNIPTQSTNQKPQLNKPTGYDSNSGLNKNPPTGYKNHDEILRNIPSQGLQGIPSYQPITKQGINQQQQSSSSAATSGTSNQRLPSRGQIDNNKPSYPSQPKNPSKNAFDDLEEDTELQKAIQQSLNQKPVTQKVPSQQQPQNVRQNSNKNMQAAQKPQPNASNRPPSAAYGADNDEEELQRAIMESMKGQNQYKKPSGNSGSSKPNYGGQYGNEDNDEELAKAIMMSYKQK